MSGSGKTMKDTLLSKEERASADGKKCTFLLGMLLLQIREGSDETKRFGFVLEDLIRSTTWNDEDIIL